MKRTIFQYYLYCMNFDCGASIYNGNVEIKMPLTVKNISVRHFCKCCRKPLISAIDVEIKNVFTEISSRIAAKPNYLKN